MTKSSVGTVLGIFCCSMLLLADDAAEKVERSGPGKVLGEPLWRSQAGALSGDGLVISDPSSAVLGRDRLLSLDG